MAVGLYSIYKSQTNDLTAFFSVFCSLLHSLLSSLPILPRQEIGELVYVIIIMLLVLVPLDKLRRALLLLIFTFSLLMSHYGLAAIYVVMLGLCLYY